MLPTVPVPRKRLDGYVEAAGAEAVERLLEAAKPLAGARILHVNSTAFGGGVAELLLTHLAFMRDLDIDASWAVLRGNEDFFAVTKAAHNGLQGGEAPWTPEMASVYEEETRNNAAELPDDFDFYVMHDPQPAGLIRVLEGEGQRNGRWIWRAHIDLSEPNDAVWEYFCPLIDRYDAAIFTMEEFAQPDLTNPKIAIIPPSIDPESTKNCDVSEDAAWEILGRYDIDRRRPILSQVSRFDPWKDPIGVIDAYRLVTEKVPEAQLVLAGSMAHDDPEGWHFLQATEEWRAGDPDIHLLTNFQDVGNLEINAIQRESTVVVQKSIREGFGLVVTEAMWKERPVVAGNVGGIRLQIEDGVSGYLIDSIEECAERVTELLDDPDKRARMGCAARERVRERFLSLREVEDHLRLMASMT